MATAYSQNVSENLNFRQLYKSTRELGLLRDPKFCQLLRFVEIDPEDSELRSMLLESVERAQLEAIISPDPFRATSPTVNQFLPGSILLGKTISGAPWLVTPEMLTNHMGIFGRSGGGKTNLIKLIVLQLLEMKKCSA